MSPARTNRWPIVFQRITTSNLNPSLGSEQGGIRPVLILQNNTGNFFCPTLIVAPITSRIWKKPMQPTHCRIEYADADQRTSMVLLEQIKTIDKQRIIKYLGNVSDEQMRDVDDCIETSLGLRIAEDTEAP